MSDISLCKLLFFDCETSGLTPTDCIIEMGCILTDPSGEKVLEVLELKVKPSCPVDPRAAAVNGYTDEGWSNAVEPFRAFRELSRLSASAVFVAHNVSFDWSFVEREFKKYHSDWRGSYHRACTMAMSFPLLKMGRVPNVKLPTLVDFFGFEQRKAHSAMSDVEDCRNVYLGLMQMWEKLRKVKP